jgi:hypothetical protein
MNIGTDPPRMIFVEYDRKQLQPKNANISCSPAECDLVAGRGCKGALTLKPHYQLQILCAHCVLRRFSRWSDDCELTLVMQSFHKEQMRIPKEFSGIKKFDAARIGFASDRILNKIRMHVVGAMRVHVLRGK